MRKFRYKTKLFIAWSIGLLLGILIGAFHWLTFRLFYKKPEGYVLNPLRKIGNYPCGCKSGRKTKHCHGSVKYVKESEAPGLQNFVNNVKNLKE